MEDGKVIGIIGTRKRDTATAFKQIRDKFFEVYQQGDYICSGGCGKGGDRCAESIAKKFGIPIITFYPDYDQFGRGAPLVRNGSIAKKCDVIIACIMHPEEGIEKVLQRKSGGTEDTLKKFVKAKGTNDKIYLV